MGKRKPTTKGPVGGVWHRDWISTELMKFHVKGQIAEALAGITRIDPKSTKWDSPVVTSLRSWEECICACEKPSLQMVSIFHFSTTTVSHVIT